MEDLFTDEMYEIDEFEDSSTDNRGEGDNPPVNNGGDQESSTEEDFTTEVLRLKGIADPNKIKFTDETGAIVERSWDSLSRTEQLSIMSDQQPEDTELEEDEIALINEIRNSGLSVKDYMNNIQPVQQVVEEPSYKINELTDDEVFALDLIDRVGSENISDEEIEEALANAKQNDALFKKTVSSIRNEYIRLQQDQEARQAAEIAEQNRQRYDNFAKSISNEIYKFNSFAGQAVQLSRDDQEELAEFLLKLDDNGQSAFGRALNNPKMFTKAAFWLLNEEKITEEITRQMQDTYKRGYAQAKMDLQQSKSVFKPKKATKNQELFLDDEDW